MCNVVYEVQEDIIDRFCNTIGIRSVDFSINNYDLFLGLYTSKKHFVNGLNVSHFETKYFGMNCYLPA